MNWRSLALARSPIWCYAPALAVLLIGVTITISSSNRLRQQSRAMNHARFGRAVNQTIGTIQNRIHQYEMAALSTADLFSGRDSITWPEWRFRLQLLSNDQNYPGLLEAGFAELAPMHIPAPSPVKDFALLQGHSRDTSQFRILHAWARAPSAMSGVDPNFLTEPDQANAAWESLLGSKATLSGIRQLSAEVNGQPGRGVSIFAPVFTTSTNAAGAAEIDNDHSRLARGVCFCAIEPNLLLEALFGVAPREIGFELFSQPVASPAHWLNPSSKTPRALDPKFRAHIETNLLFQVANRTWSIYCYTTPLFERESSFARPWMILPLGLGLTVALTGLLAIQIRARVRQNSAAAELKSAYHDLQRAQNERERVSRELHDGAIQSLYLLGLTLGRCDRLLKSNPAQASEIMAQARFSVDDLISDLRRFLLQDDTKSADIVGFDEVHAVLRELSHRLHKTESIQIQVTGQSSAAVSLTAAQLGHVKQIAQEAVSNILRHSHATAIHLSLSTSNLLIQLTISDNGQGFDLQRASGTGNGLANMQARAVHLGGTLQINANPGRGSTLILVFPGSPVSECYHE